MNNIQKELLATNAVNELERHCRVREVEPKFVLSGDWCGKIPCLLPKLSAAWSGGYVPMVTLQTAAQ